MSARILLVEDEILVALSISETLRESGFKVDSVDSGNPVIMEAVRGPWDAALVDMGLPDCSGIDVVCHLRTQQPEIPIILTTGMETPETIAFATECKLTLLPKPFYEHQLLPLLHLALSNSSARRVLPE
jgi:DNA-binding response OmpR family regulator